MSFAMPASPPHALGEERKSRAPLHPTMAFEGDRLVLGAGTPIAVADRRLFLTKRDGEVFDEARVAALLAVACGRAITPSELRYVREALRRQSEGENMLALMNLALANLPKLQPPDEAAWRLSAADGLLQSGMSSAELLSELGLVLASAVDFDWAYNPDQPRVPAGNGRTSGQWTGEDAVPDPSAAAAKPVPADDSATGGVNAPIQIGDSSENWPQSLNPVTTADAATRNRDPQDPGVRVVLPNGKQIPTGDPPPKPAFLMSPIADLAPVAAAGREIGSTYAQFLSAADPDIAAGAFLYLGVNLAIYLGYGGIFDYQRQGSVLTGFLHSNQFADVSNFNVGLFCQQAGLTLDDTLRIAGIFAKLFSSNHDSSKPYHLADIQSKYIRLGYQTGSSGVFDPPSPP